MIMTHKRIYTLLIMLLPLLATAQNYAILLPNNAGEVEQKAAAEFSYFAREAMGKDIPIAANTAYNDTTIYISIGKTPLAAEVYNKYSPQLKWDGFAVCSKGGNLFLVGNEGKALLYAVYHYWEKYGGARMFSANELMIPHRTALAMVPEGVADVQNPSFQYRETLHVLPNISQRYADFHHLHNRKDMESSWGMFVHTYQHLVPEKKYFGSHPEWFAQVNGRRVRDGQLCLSNEAVFEELCKNLQIEIDKNPAATIWSVSQNDNINACTCPECLKLDSMYGGQSGTMLWFTNKVAERFPDKTISMLAYQHTRNAPKNIKPRGNVNIMLCSIESQRQAAIATNDAEKGFVKDVEDWTALTDNIFLWDYVVQFRNYMDPFPNLHVLQPNLQFFHRHGIKMMFEQGSGDNVTENHVYRTYLLSKLMWNVNVDVDSLRTDFLTHYYGEGIAPLVATYYDTMQHALVQSGQVLNIYGYPINAKNGYLSQGMIEYYKTLFHRMYMQTLDTVVVNRIRLLELPLDFAILDMSMSNLSAELSYFTTQDGKKSLRPEMMAMAERFVADCKKHGVRKLEEIEYPPARFLSNIRNYVSKSMEENLAQGKPITCATKWSNAYDVGGPSALVDGNFGIVNYNYNWLGFWGEHLDATIDLQEVKDIHEISLDFFSYPLSWIFVPEKVEFYISTDSINWEKVGEDTYRNEEVLAVAKIEKMSSPRFEKKARYVRVFAQSILQNPSWHRGYGNPSWIFTDEILVK